MSDDRRERRRSPKLALAKEALSTAIFAIFTILLIVGCLNSYSEFDKYNHFQIHEITCALQMSGMAEWVEPPMFLFGPKALNVQKYDTWVLKPGIVQPNPSSPPGDMGTQGSNATLFTVMDKNGEGGTMVISMVAFFCMKLVLGIVTHTTAFAIASRERWRDGLKANSRTVRLWAALSSPLTALNLYLPAFVIGWVSERTPWWFTKSRWNVGQQFCNPVIWRPNLPNWRNITYFDAQISKTGPLGNITEPMDLSFATGAPNLIFTLPMVVAGVSVVWVLGAIVYRRLIMEPEAEDTRDDAPQLTSDRTVVKTLDEHKWMVRLLALAVLSFVVTVIVGLGFTIPLMSDAADIVNLVTFDVSNFGSFSSINIESIGSIAGTEVVLQIVLFVCHSIAQRVASFD